MIKFLIFTFFAMMCLFIMHLSNIFLADHAIANTIVFVVFGLALSILLALIVMRVAYLVDINKWLENWVYS